MKKLANYFFQGLLLIAPAGLTIYILYLIFRFIDDPLQTYIKDLVGFTIPGLGLVVIVVFLTLLGIIGNYIVTDPFTNLIERLIRKAPVIEMIYTSLKDFLSAFVGKERRFNKPVRVIADANTGFEKIGFITEDDLKSFGVKEKVAVYFPYSLSFMGELFFVPADRVIPVDLPAAEVMKFIVAGGLAKMTPPDEKEINEKS
ncbi:MAG: DUF502 domain-containing protein [Bacteroidales bacterium]